MRPPYRVLHPASSRVRRESHEGRRPRAAPAHRPDEFPRTNLRVPRGWLRLVAKIAMVFVAWRFPVQDAFSRSRRTVHQVVESPPCSAGAQGGRSEAGLEPAQVCCAVARAPAVKHKTHREPQLQAFSPLSRLEDPRANVRVHEVGSTHGSLPWGGACTARVDGRCHSQYSEPSLSTASMHLS